MPGQRRLDGDSCRLDVTHFPNHDDIRVLTDDGPEGRGKGQSDLWLGLDLIDPFKLVFDRILDGNDLSVGGIDLV